MAVVRDAEVEMLDSCSGKRRAGLRPILPDAIPAAAGTFAAPARRVVLVLGTLLIVSCNDDPYDVVNLTGTLGMTVTTAGVDVDADGYELRVNNRTPMTVLVNGSFSTPLPAGHHFVELRGVAGNCAVNGGNSRNVTITPGETVQVTFAVTCIALATLHVTTVTTGVDPDPDGYRLHSLGPDPVDRGTIGTAGRVMIRGLVPRGYVLELRDVAANCDVAGGHSSAVEATSGDTVAVAFHVACAAVTRLVYASWQDGGHHIYVINSNGASATRLTRTGTNTDPAWSPDGSSIAFTRDGDIYVMDADGSNVRRLTTDAEQDYQPAWSADGSRIAFVRERTRTSDLYVMNADGSNERPLTSLFTSVNREPAWSPDGRKIAFSSDREGLSIYVMNADGTGVVRLTTGGRDESPAWSPDGTRIAFTRDECRRYPCLPAIHVMDADGSGVRWVATGRQAAWSADGSRIAYAAVLCGEPWYCGDQTERIRIVHADGDEVGPTVVDLTRGMHDSRPDWRR